MKDGIPIARTAEGKHANPSRKETPRKENERSERMSDRGTADEHTPAPAAGGSLDPQDWTGLREQWRISPRRV